MNRRFMVLSPGYLAIFTLCLGLAFELRFEFDVPAEYRKTLRDWLFVAIGLKMSVAWLIGDWKCSYRYTSVADIISLVSMVTVSNVILYAIGMIGINAQPIPRATLAIDWALALIAFGGIRVCMSYYADHIRLRLTGTTRDGKRSVILGADGNSIAIHRALKSVNSGYRVLAFVKETNEGSQLRANGIPVLSTVGSSWADIVRQLNVRHILIPGSVAGLTVRRIIEDCAGLDATVHVIPEVKQLVSGKFRIAMRDVTINDLLQREPTQINLDTIRRFVTGKRVLVTGGAGSIGSELCRQLLDLDPRTLTLIDQSELGMFEIESELVTSRTTSTNLSFHIADIRDRPSIQQIFENERPEIVFHAAAYKHVPLMERNPAEAIRNNVFGTKTIIDLAGEFHVDRFVLISSDKAVEPTSVMGATKLITEKCLQAATQTSPTMFMTVRFGNVLNSSGSVVSVFRKQIENGHPLTVTHPEMERFFLTIPEAVQLVLRAVAIGKTGDLLILDMGEPVKIVDLAKSVILLSGLRYPEDVDIVFTGMRPGEKLTEELYYEAEYISREKLDKITRIRPKLIAPEALEDQLTQLETAANSSPSDAARILWEVVGELNAGPQSKTEPATLPFKPRSVA